MKQCHIPILKCFDELKFNLGRRTLLDFLKGDLNSTIERNSLDELDSYGSLYMMDKDDIGKAISILLKKGYIETFMVNGSFQVLRRTAKGTKEIFERKFEVDLSGSKSKKIIFNFEEAELSGSEKQIVTAFNFFLEKFNEEQKKAIVANSKNILCIAGAGSGKTTVLTKRIEFLTKFRGVKSKDILAITFTKKAKEEMAGRLKELGVIGCHVETFNSFCEKILKRKGNLIYENEVRVASFSDKIRLVNNSLKRLGVPLDTIADDYFNKRQLREKSKDELFFIFVNDVFSIVDFYKNKEENFKEFYLLEKNSVKKRVAKVVYDVAVDVSKSLRRSSLRDFTDQIIDTLRLFRKCPDEILKFKHVLVDEFQDVNLVQNELLKTLNSENLFAVGDPRQAIYGWRGSDISFILNFPKNFEGTEVVILKKNYRSCKQIVDVSNIAAESMRLPDLISSKEDDNEKHLFLVEQQSEMMEKVFVAEAIKNSKNKRNEIFVLARTNRILENFADYFTTQGIKFAIKSEEEYKTAEPKEDEIVLATVHSIKGMEANEVYIVSANTLSFPNKVQDNFVFSLVKDGEEYDKVSEELRLFYVALSRAREKLVISYTGNLSKFVSDKMLSMFNVTNKNKSLFEYGSDIKRSSLDSNNSGVLKMMLKDWRSEKADAYGLPVYMVVSNKAIDEISSRKPMSKDELLQINGLGEMKVAKYGDEIIRIVSGG